MPQRENAVVLAVPALLGLMTAIGFNYIQLVAKQFARRNGPMPWPVIFRQQNILTRQERAIGIELMVSALAAQVGVLITSAQDQTTNALVAHYLNANMSQSVVNIRVLWTVFTILIFFSLLIRLFGYEASGNLKEDWGVTVPKAAGILLIVFVYLLSPAASAVLPLTHR